MNCSGIVRDEELEKCVGKSIRFGHPMSPDTFVGELRRYSEKGREGYCVIHPETKVEHKILDGHMVRLPSSNTTYIIAQTYRKRR